MIITFIQPFCFLLCYAFQLFWPLKFFSLSAAPVSYVLCMEYKIQFIYTKIHYMALKKTPFPLLSLFSVFNTRFWVTKQLDMIYGHGTETGRDRTRGKNRVESILPCNLSTWFVNGCIFFLVSFNSNLQGRSKYLRPLFPWTKSGSAQGSSQILRRGLVQPCEDSN